MAGMVSPDMYVFMSACMHACMYVCSARMYAPMHACMHVCIHACMHVCMHACVHVCTCHVCVYACMYVCMYVCLYTSYIYTNSSSRGLTGILAPAAAQSSGAARNSRTVRNSAARNRRTGPAQGDAIDVGTKEHGVDAPPPKLPRRLLQQMPAATARVHHLYRWMCVCVCG